jgi:glycosyltransferase involved in cell wall biosynthesis
MKLLYISSILRTNSFGEVSQKLIKLLLKSTDWDIYLFHINTTKTYAKQEMNNFPGIKDIKYVPDYKKQRNKDHKNFSNIYTNGIFHLRKYVLEINPDVIITLHNDKQTWMYSKILNDMRDVWKGKFMPYIPMDFTHSIRSYLHKGFNVDALLTMNEWSKQQVETHSEITAPIYSIPHIVEDFYPINVESKQKLKDRLYKENAHRYIVGCVNANNGRKRLDFVIEAFKRFHKQCPNSMLVLKTTKEDAPGGNIQSHRLSDLREKIKGYPIAMLAEYLKISEVQDLYRSFDIMINATDGEGFGLTPFEGGLAGVLSILPNNSSFSSLVENGVVPDYLLPCRTMPSSYVRSHLDILPILSGRVLHSVYYDTMHYQDEKRTSSTFFPTVFGITTYVFSTLSDPPTTVGINSNTFSVTKVFSKMEDLVKADWNDLQIQVLITSDIATVRAYTSWMLIYKDFQWPGRLRWRQMVPYQSMNEYVGYDGPMVGLIEIQDLCDKMIFYKNNPEKYEKDLQQFQNFIRTNFSEKKVFESLYNAITETVHST